MTPRDPRRPLRVVIATRIFSPEPSAASFVLETIARRFRDAGHEVTVVTTRPPKQLAVADLPGITVKRAPVLRDRSGYVRGYLPYLSFDVPLFFRLLFSRGADLYLVEPPPTTGAVVRVVAALRRRPYVYDAADLWSDAAAMATSSSIVLGLLRRVEQFAMRGAAHAFAISEGLIGRMRELAIPVPATAIGFGVDTEAFHYIPAADLGEQAQPYFVYAGTYSEWHGAGILLEAFAEFSAARPGYRLVFVGNGSERELLEGRRDELGLDTVEFHDPIESARLNTLLNGAVASLATLKPGQGYDYAFTTKVYSSIAAGCPILFTGVGPTIAFIDGANASQRTGSAVGYDIGAVRDSMIALADSPFTPEQRRALSDWSRANHSLTAIADVVVRTSAELVRARG